MNMLTNYPKLRLTVYLVALIAAVVAPVIAVTSPEYATAVVTASGVLMAAAGFTAASNVTPTVPVVQIPVQAQPSDNDIDLLVAEMQAEGKSEEPVPDSVSDAELAGLPRHEATSQ